MNNHKSNKNSQIRKITTLILIVVMLVMTAASCRSEQVGDPGSGSGGSVEAGNIENNKDENKETDKADLNENTNVISEDGEYTSVKDVAEYIHVYHKLPSNYVTRSKAKQLGWEANTDPREYNIIIGGEKWKNREKKLPEDKYFECDVNYNGDGRGPERLIYTEEGIVYYTKDHYQTFEQLYGEG